MSLSKLTEFLNEVLHLQYHILHFFVLLFILHLIELLCLLQIPCLLVCLGQSHIVLNGAKVT